MNETAKTTVKQLDKNTFFSSKAKTQLSEQFVAALQEGGFHLEQTQIQKRQTDLEGAWPELAAASESAKKIIYFL